MLPFSRWDDWRIVIWNIQIILRWFWWHFVLVLILRISALKTFCDFVEVFYFYCSLYVCVCAFVCVCVCLSVCMSICLLTSVDFTVTVTVTRRNFYWFLPYAHALYPFCNLADSCEVFTEREFRQIFYKNLSFIGLNSAKISTGHCDCDCDCKSHWCKNANSLLVNKIPAEKMHRFGRGFR